MKNYLLSMTVLLLLSFSCLANELAIAPDDVISDYIELCNSYAIEENIEENQLNEYLLNCVNDELTANGYEKIEKLDKN